MNFGTLGCLALIVLSLHAAADELVIQEHRSMPAGNEGYLGLRGEGHISISRDGKIVATSQFPGRFTVWDAQSGKMLSKLDLPENPMLMTMSAEGRYLAALGLETTIVWDWIDQRIVWSDRGRFGPSFVAIDSKRKAFYLLDGNSILIRSLDSGEETGQIDLGKVKPETITVLDSGELLVLCQETGILKVDPTKCEVIAQIDPGYPRVPSFDEKAIAARPEFAGYTKIDGRAFMKIDPSGKRVFIQMRGGKADWFKVGDTTDLAFSLAAPTTEQTRSVIWLGNSGKLLEVRGKTPGIIDPAHPAQVQELPLVLPKRRTSADWATDETGRTIVFATDGGWMCFEGDPSDPASWRERTMPEPPPASPPLAHDPERNRLLHGGEACSLWSTSLTGTVEAKKQAVLEDAVRAAGALPDGTLIATTRRAYYHVREGMPPAEIQTTRSRHETGLLPCGDSFLLRVPAPNLRSADWTYGAFVPPDKLGELFPMTRPPVLHERLPVMVSSVYSDAQKVRYQVSEITKEHKQVIVHEVDVTGYTILPPIVESRDSFLTAQWEQSLVRVKASTGEVTPLRDDLPVNIRSSHLFPTGDRVLLLRDYPFPPLIYPLDAGTPVIEISGMTGEWVGQTSRLGFTRNGKGVWLSMNNGSAGLWDGQTGKRVAEVITYEDGTSLLALPDGRCTFSENARGRAFLRKLGSTELTPVESTPGVLEVLAPYLEMP